MPAKRWIVLGDVVDSREAPSRNALREAVRNTCREINQSFVQQVSAPFVILKGVDEIGGALRGPAILYDVVARLQAALAPLEIRTAAAYDEVDVGWRTGEIAQMDGAAFHVCARLITEMRKTHSRVEVRSGDPVFDRAASAQLHALWLIKQPWTERQRQVYELAQQELSQAEIGSRLGTSQQSVSKSLGAVRANQVSRIERQTREWLAEATYR